MAAAGDGCAPAADPGRGRSAISTKAVAAPQPGTSSPGTSSARAAAGPSTRRTIPRSVQARRPPRRREEPPLRFGPRGRVRALGGLAGHGTRHPESQSATGWSPSRRARAPAPPPRRSPGSEERLWDRCRWSRLWQAGAGGAHVETFSRLAKLRSSFLIPASPLKTTVTSWSEPLTSQLTTTPSPNLAWRTRSPAAKAASV